MLEHHQLRRAATLVLGCALCLGAAGCSDDDDGGDGGGGPSGEPPELLGITQAHNDERALVGVGPLQWDDALAEVARSWAESCTDVESPPGLVDHNAGRSDSYPGYVGENIYGSSAGVSGPQAVSAWASEKADYDYETNTCASICGHYTQIVWAASVKLGCGYADCAGLSYSHTVVCNYSPGGNTGGQPY